MPTNSHNQPTSLLFDENMYGDKTINIIILFRNELRHLIPIYNVVQLQRHAMTRP